MRGLFTPLPFYCFILPLLLVVGFDGGLVEVEAGGWAVGARGICVPGTVFMEALMRLAMVLWGCGWGWSVGLGGLVGCGLGGGCFHFLILACAPKRYICLELRRSLLRLPSLSSNANTREETVYGAYDDGVQIQLGFCVIFSKAYRGLSIISALWHCSGVYASLSSSVLPVGMPLRVTLDHLMFGLVVIEWTWSLKAKLNWLMMAVCMKGAAASSCSWVTLRPVVSIMFPLLVHLADVRWTATWAELCRWELMAWQRVFRTISCRCSEVVMLLRPRTRLGLARATALVL